MYSAATFICRKGSFKAFQLYLVFRHVYGYCHLSGKFRFGNGNLFRIDLGFALGIQRIYGNDNLDFIGFQRPQDDTLAFTDVLVFQGSSNQSLFGECSADIRPVVRLHRIVGIGIQGKFGIFNESFFLINLYVFISTAAFEVLAHVAFVNSANHILGTFGTLLHHYVYGESGKVLDFKFHQLGHYILALECEFL